MHVKEFVHIETLYRIGHCKQLIKKCCPDFEERAKASTKRVFFLDAPSYGNLGDQAIAFAMREFIRKTLPDYSQFEIQEDEFPLYYRWLKKNIREEDVICLTGGGNMGTNYRVFEGIRRLVIGTFKNNLIVVFPQTIDYSSDSYGEREKHRSVQIYSKAKKLILAAREKKSYDIMQTVYYFSDVIFVPDIVMSLDYRKYRKDNGEICYCFRKDLEKCVSEETVQAILDKFHSDKSISTNYTEHERITEKERQIILESRLKEFARAKLIITDRLHAMIFAYITGTPCIALPNSNGKIEGVYQWVKEGSVIFCKDYPNDFKIPTLGKSVELEGEFERLAAAIRNRL